jgi:hypothetical protein
MISMHNLISSTKVHSGLKHGKDRLEVQINKLCNTPWIDITLKLNTVFNAWESYACTSRGQTLSSAPFAVFYSRVGIRELPS